MLCASDSIQMAAVNNLTNGRQSRYSDEMKTNAVVFVSIDAILALLTIVSNGLFLTALKVKPALHTPTNMLLGALSLSDLFVGIVVQPFWIVKFCFILADRETVSFDYLRFLITWFAVFLSLVYIVSVTVDRYTAIAFPFWYHAKATCKTHLLLAGAIFIISTSLYSLGQVTFAYGSTTAAGSSYYACMGVALVLTGYCNVRIFIVTKKLKGETNAIERVANIEERKRTALQKIQEKNKNVIILLITCLFFACYLPFLVQTFRERLVGFDSSNRATLYVNNVWYDFCILLNSLVNPIVYYARLKSFRKAAKKVFCKSPIH